MLLGHFESGSAEWHAARAGIGGSDIGTICGINQYKSREELLGEAVTGSKGLLEPNLAMRLGTAFEAPIRRLWAEDNAEWLSVEETGTWQSLVNPFWTANPDGIIKWNDGELGLLEIKNSQARKVPESWVYQVQWYLMILGLRRGVIVQCVGNKFLEHSIEANVFLQMEMREQATKYEKQLEELLNGIR